MKAIVLAGGQEFGQCPLSRHTARAMWPVLDRPVVEHVLAVLRGAGVGELSISANGQTQRIAEALATRGLNVGLHYSEDARPRGAAGCIKDCQSWLGGETFLVVHGASLLLKVDFEHLLREHRQARSAMTIATNSHGQAATSQPAGLYICEQAVFPYIAPRGYQDMKEQLIPRLTEAGLTVQAVGLRGRVVPILNEECYLNAMIELLEHAEWHRPLTAHLPAKVPGLWVDPAASVHPRARVVGPAYIGAGATIGADALVIGPVQIGAGCRVEAEAVVHESILWAGARVGEGAVVEQSILANGAAIATQEEVRGMIILDSESGATDVADAGEESAVLRRAPLWRRILGSVRPAEKDALLRRPTQPGIITP